jgi:[protein-PII] uridylyltransferase
MAALLERDDLFADKSLRGAAFCAQYSARVDDWLADIYGRAGAPKGVALVAVGGYGRAELCPQSDIDLVLVHRGRKDIAEVAQTIWYPIWDAGLKLGHAVRTPKEAVALASEELDTATSLLSCRHVAGDADLSVELGAAALQLWRKRSKRFLAELGERVGERQAAVGEVAFLLEPDLKDGRGGLRDVQAIRWAESAEQVMFEGDDALLSSAYDMLLAVRVELHRLTGRPGDRLLLQEQDAVAAALDDDADAMMARVASSARSIAWASDEVWDAIARTARAGRGWRSSRDRALGAGIVLREGRVHVNATDDEVRADPTLPLRAAAAAAEHDTRIERQSLDHLSELAPPMPAPWPPVARERLVDLLLAGPPAIPVLESLDQRGLFTRVLPEWEAVRSRPQRNAYHRFTVDRHLCEAAVEASALADRVDRPDLLVIGALLHDIGKGYSGDHTQVGVDLVGVIGPRMGFAPDDVDVLTELVRLHLLLPDVATRRDLADDATIALVADEVGDIKTLRLLAALTEADSIATGPAAWGSWKAELVFDLVRRTEFVLGGGSLAEVTIQTFPTDVQNAMLAKREQQLVGGDDRLTVVSPDRPGLFSRVAGVLALNGLDVLDANVVSDDEGWALETFRVESALGPTIAWDRVVADLERALDGRLALRARLADRVRTYGSPRRTTASRAVAKVDIDNQSSALSTVVEVYAPDGIGVLYRITRAIAEVDLDIKSAKVQTLGSQVVDSFYLRDRAGKKLTDDAHLAELEVAILHSLRIEQL